MDGNDELVTAKGTGTSPEVRIWNVSSGGIITGLIDSILPFSGKERGASVAAGDLDNDGKFELLSEPVLARRQQSESMEIPIRMERSRTIFSIPSQRSRPRSKAASNSPPEIRTTVAGMSSLPAHGPKVERFASSRIRMVTDPSLM
jgi:hypothetical protein